MKVFNLVLCIIFLNTSGFTSDPCKTAPISVLSRKRDIFYFKVCKEFMGARIEVYSPEGELLATEEITHQKALVDFFFEKPGDYKIVFKKDEEEKIFIYSKLNPEPVVLADVENQIVISQQ
jgi:hypothetical protein